MVFNCKLTSSNHINIVYSFLAICGLLQTRLDTVFECNELKLIQFLYFCMRAKFLKIVTVMIKGYSNWSMTNRICNIEFDNLLEKKAPYSSS